MAYTFAADSLGLFLFSFCHGLQKTHLFCNRVRIGRLRANMVDNIGTNRKCICDFLLVRHCNCGLVLHRFWDTATYWLKKLPIFPIHLTISHSCTLCSRWNVAVKLSTRKLHCRVTGVSCREDRMIVTWVILTWYQTVTDRQTDGRTESIIANTAACIASYADALSKDRQSMYKQMRNQQSIKGVWLCVRV